jgi:hypothetical protein
MFTVLVGRAGIGKGMAMSPATTILEEAGCANILSDRLTMEYILEKLSKGFPHSSPTAGGGLHLGLDSSAIIISPELSILITASLATLPVLCDLWDARDRDFSYGTRHKGEYKIKSPCVSILGASTPQWLVSSIPQSAIGGGFTRRVNFVYGKERSQRLPWPATNHSDLRAKLVEDMRSISTITGEYQFTEEAKPIFEKLYDESEPDDYDDEATTSYKTSKWAHATKLAMVLAAARGESLLIDKDIMEEAAQRVDEVSKDVPMVFRAVGESDLVAAADRILTFIELRGYASKDEIMRTMWRHISIEDLDRVLESFAVGGLLVESNQAGKRVFRTTPKAKRSVTP